MWDMPIAAIPGPWVTLPGLPSWLALAAVAGVLATLALAVASAPRRRVRRAEPVRRLHGVRAA